MGKLTSLLEFIRNYDYPLTPSEKSIAQKERNELKYNLSEGIIEILISEGLEYVHRTTDGYIVEMQNTELGFIPVEINIKIKDLTYDVDAAISEWEAKVEEAKEKEAKRLATEKAKEERAARAAKVRSKK